MIGTDCFNSTGEPETKSAADGNWGLCLQGDAIYIRIAK